jgi:hypothetical protein
MSSVYLLSIKDRWGELQEEYDIMKKPLNKVALALWIIAALFVLGEAWSIFDMFRTADQFRGGHTHLAEGSITRLVQSTIGMAAMLTALGVLIELVDQILWTIVRATEKN